MKVCYVDGEVLTGKCADSYAQLMLRTLRPPQTLHFGGGQVAADGWAPSENGQALAFASNALVKSLRITKLVRQLEDSHFGQELPDVCMIGFNTRLWLQAQSDPHGPCVRARLHSSFAKLSHHYRLPTNRGDFLNFFFEQLWTTEVHMNSRSSIVTMKK